MRGLMQETPLMISSLLRHADRFHGDTQIVSRTCEGTIHRHTYREAHARTRRLANALRRLGVGEGDRVATLAWNGYRHFELYYAVSGIGAIVHTVNPRLFPEQLVYIVNHADDAYVCFDITFAALVGKLAPACPRVKGWIAMTDRAHMPSIGVGNLLCYEELLAAESDALEWPVFDENAAAGLCYTSGTTGNPKGVLFSHRSSVLHAWANAIPDAACFSSRTVLLPVVPMFHVNAWGMPYGAPMVGVKLVLPGPGLDGASLHELMEREGVTLSTGVPTVWLNLIHYMKQHGLRFSSLRMTIVGGAALPEAMLKTLRDEFGLEVRHGWGMTEMSPVGTVNAPKSKHDALSADERHRLALKQGRPLYGVDMRIVDAGGQPLPHDGVAFGELQVKGPWILREYYRGEGGDPLVDGWFPTGDVGTIDPDGYLQITDRAKDVIKSGGEWISSIELENVAVGHPAILEAAVIGVKHAKWSERPLLIAVKKPGAEVTKESLRAYYQGKVAKWAVPDDVVFVDEIPHTATGKISKMTLRRQFADYRLPAAASVA
ncbi:MAG TPA: 3-(methylthio)propionyl-CoA ligase [Usitatibacter sp.]|nr:3-(methylthio)propionyl-CoA ligase [Usitatibacter sp.]